MDIFPIFYYMMISRHLGKVAKHRKSKCRRGKTLKIQNIENLECKSGCASMYKKRPKLVINTASTHYSYISSSYESCGGESDDMSVGESVLKV